MTQLTLDQAAAEKARQQAAYAYWTAPKGKRRERKAALEKAVNEALAADPVVSANLISGVKAR